MSGKTLGQAAFEAYRAQVKTAFNGDPIPEWEQLDNGALARAGWEAAANAVLIEQHSRRGAAAQREIPTRWRPVGEFIPAQHGELSADKQFKPLPPVDDKAIMQAGVSVPVEAEEDDGSDDPVECDHPGCTIRHS